MLDPGEYDVLFEIKPLGYTSLDDTCCRIDVAIDLAKELLLQRNLCVVDLIRSEGRVSIEFTLTKKSVVEYRVEAIGGTEFSVAFHRMATPAALRGTGVLLTDHPLYKEYCEAVISLESGGIRFRPKGDELIAQVNGLVLEIKSQEDLQVCYEVFVANDYTIAMPRKCIAIDIGMNVGMASMALSLNPEIDRVFSYEPFLTPFRRAIRHFQLNPHLFAKIRPMRCGLADREDELQVKSNPSATIGVSIQGLGTGDPETIRICDAAKELGPKMEQANREGLGIILKIDCEGSEFAIFDSLGRANLFDKIDAFMIEWHKWWSADKTQADLIAPLVDCGFFVFDRTNPQNPFSGFLQAVRSSRG